LVRAGGVYAPVSCLVPANRNSECRSAVKQPGDIFTARQAAVVKALRKGKANKIIAYELNMRESTVKVHVRNIMKKLSAKNRTEVAYITRGLMDGKGTSRGPALNSSADPSLSGKAIVEWSWADHAARDSHTGEV
jgi:DNA-binding CsgD family transcriptional regulator